jgi:hypothetical protein
LNLRVAHHVVVIDAAVEPALDGRRNCDLVPLEMIAFLLFEVKSTGLLVTRNLLVDSSAVTMASNALPAVKKPLKPEEPAIAMFRICSCPAT